MSKLMDFELITPEGVLVQEKISELVAVTELGEIGILYGHAAIKSKLVSAPLRYKLATGSQDLVAVLGGVLELTDNKLTIITGFAEHGADIDEAEAHQASEKARAEYQVLNPNAANIDRDLILAEAKLNKELLRFQTAKLKKQYR